MESVIENRIKVHFNVIKGIGVVLMLYSTTITILLGVNRETFLACVSEPNRPGCNKLSKTHLGKEVYVSSCTYAGRVKVDLRRFVNGRATGMGIVLDGQQWAELIHNSDSITKALHPVV